MERVVGCSVFSVDSPIVVNANIKRWTITSDDIYLLRFKEAPPEWLKDIIDNIIDSQGFVTDINGLADRFNNFEVGYFEHLYDFREADKHIIARVENLYVENGLTNAGIQKIEGVLSSTVESQAWQNNLVGAWIANQGGAWFDQRVSTISNVGLFGS